MNLFPALFIAELQQKEKELKVQTIHLKEVENSKLEKAVLERIKQLQQLNKSLFTSEERYHRMVKEVQDYSILFLSKRGIIENWNEGAEKIKGYKEEESVCKSFTMFYPEGDREKKLPEHLLPEASKNGRATHECWKVRKDGTLFWANSVITALHDEKPG